MDMLNIPATSKARAITTMKAAIDAHEAKKDYGPSAAIKSGRGAKVLIEDYTHQAEVVYRVMESEVWHLMEQTWTAVGVPTNTRITGDISGWERVCGKIIEAKGTIELPDRPPCAEDARRGGT